MYNSDCNLTIPEDNPRCLDPVDGTPGYVFEAGNGPTTGRCVRDKNGEGRCEIMAWCDVEDEIDNITYVVVV